MVSLVFIPHASVRTRTKLESRLVAAAVHTGNTAPAGGSHRREHRPAHGGLSKTSTRPALLRKLRVLKGGGIDRDLNGTVPRPGRARGVYSPACMHASTYNGTAATPATPRRASRASTQPPLPSPSSRPLQLRRNTPATGALRRVAPCTSLQTTAAAARTVSALGRSRRGDGAGQVEYGGRERRWGSQGRMPGHS
jgi:hypothetical protein